MKMGSFSTDDHLFAICAYKENPYLKDCIQSLLKQSCKSAIIMVASTPNNHIQELCSIFEIPLYINNNSIGIASDWNFAYQQMKDKKLLTIVHQDDIYEPDYLSQILKAANKTPDALIFYTDYYELRNDAVCYSNNLLVIKRLMNFPLRFTFLQRSKFIRRFILSFGNPICCPSVTFNKANLPALLFDDHFQNNLDYKAWTVLSKLNGAFLYCPICLVGHRVHRDSTTSVNIANSIRKKEDLEMFCEFWPKPIARIIYFFYRKSEKSNENLFTV
jgi:glycosyltransferase involved in cell wall biosynthesis